MKSMAHLLLILCLFPLLRVQGFEKMEHINSNEATVVFELIRKEDPRIACKESKKSCVERWTELHQADHFRYKKIVQRLMSGGRKDNGWRNIRNYTSGSFNLSCTGSSTKGMFINDTITILTNGTITSRYGGKFSYCIVDHLSCKNGSSYLAVGDITKSKTELRSRIQHTKLLEVPPHYAAHVVNISIRGKNLSLPLETFDLTVNNGIAVLDLSSTVTTLPPRVYDQVINELKEYLDSKCKEIGPIPPFRYCYNASGFDENSLPKLVFYFGGVRFEPPLESYIIDVEPQVKCIGLSRGDAQILVIGSMWQENHVWEFDLLHRTLGLATSTCS